MDSAWVIKCCLLDRRRVGSMPGYHRRYVRNNCAPIQLLNASGAGGTFPLVKGGQALTSVWRKDRQHVLIHLPFHAFMLCLDTAPGRREGKEGFVRSRPRRQMEVSDNCTFLFRNTQGKSSRFALIMGHRAIVDILVQGRGNPLDGSPSEGTRRPASEEIVLRLIGTLMFVFTSVWPLPRCVISNIQEN